MDARMRLQYPLRLKKCGDSNSGVQEKEYIIRVRVG